MSRAKVGTEVDLTYLEDDETDDGIDVKNTNHQDSHGDDSLYLIREECMGSAIVSKQLA